MSTPTLITDLRQRHLEAFEKRYNELRPGEEIEVRPSLTNGAVVKAAAAAGWLGAAFGEDDAGELTFKETFALAEAILKTYQEIITLDPN